ncbi:MAG: tRNA (N6-threonylcarbamoyladenosine(37)-N6)-methyltransferase TrmO [Bacteroides sp.]|nr:tRNA (N6-threonylcarbamoyladenosine(37)-N6)-methyltransferase TrmO [Bacteroides sp.]MCM1446808.1 tRNA (N6-threonylcarbamoyladenosine(37)-N6)-methyltransferase TrmO [Bacteroides sp.]
MITIAHIYNDFDSKFGIPRQSGMVNGLESRIVFTPEYRNVEALRGLDGFSHIWLLWDFSMAHASKWSPTVRPPRLGGNKRMGVWATRSPFRPNNIGLSSVRILRIEPDTPEGPVIYVEGADLMSGTPILDIKPYLPFTDSHPDATAGWTAEVRTAPLNVIITEEARRRYDFTPSIWKTIEGILAGDPRPHYQNNPERIYSFEFHGHTIRFRVNGNTATVL